VRCRENGLAGYYLRIVNAADKVRIHPMQHRLNLVDAPFRRRGDANIFVEDDVGVGSGSSSLSGLGAATRFFTTRASTP